MVKSKLVTQIDNFNRNISENSTRSKSSTYLEELGYQQKNSSRMNSKINRSDIDSMMAKMDDAFVNFWRINNKK